MPDAGVDQGRPGGEVPAATSRRWRTGADASPSGPLTCWSTATPPASMSTMAPIHGAPAGTSSAITWPAVGADGDRNADLRALAGNQGDDPGAVVAPLLAITTAPAPDRGLAPADVRCRWPRRRTTTRRGPAAGAATGTGLDRTTRPPRPEPGPASGRSGRRGRAAAARTATMGARAAPPDDGGGGPPSPERAGQTSIHTSSPSRSSAPRAPAGRPAAVRTGSPTGLIGANHSGRTVSVGGCSARRRRRSMAATPMAHRPEQDLDD